MRRPRRLELRCQYLRRISVDLLPNPHPNPFSPLQFIVDPLKRPQNHAQQPFLPPTLQPDRLRKSNQHPKIHQTPRHRRSSSIRTRQLSPLTPKSKKPSQTCIESPGTFALILLPHLSASIALRVAIHMPDDVGVREGCEVVVEFAFAAGGPDGEVVDKRCAGKDGG